MVMGVVCVPAAVHAPEEQDESGVTKEGGRENEKSNGKDRTTTYEGRVNANRET